MQRAVRRPPPTRRGWRSAPTDLRGVTLINADLTGAGVADRDVVHRQDFKVPASVRLLLEDSLSESGADVERVVQIFAVMKTSESTM